VKIAPVKAACFFYRYNKDISVNLIINLTKRIRRRKRASGEVVEQTRYVLNWSDPKSGAREQRFFERQKDAQEKRAELVAAYERGSYSASTKSVTIADAVATWLDGKRGVVRPNTLATLRIPGALRRGAVVSRRRPPCDDSFGHEPQTRCKFRER
jgi:hypothetical protein